MSKPVRAAEPSPAPPINSPFRLPDRARRQRSRTPSSVRSRPTPSRAKNATTANDPGESSAARQVSPASPQVGGLSHGVHLRLPVVLLPEHNRSRRWPPLGHTDRASDQRSVWTAYRAWLKAASMTHLEAAEPRRSPRTPSGNLNFIGVRVPGSTRIRNAPAPGTGESRIFDRFRARRHGLEAPDTDRTIRSARFCLNLPS